MTMFISMLSALISYGILKASYIYLAKNYHIEFSWVDYRLEQTLIPFCNLTWNDSWVNEKHKKIFWVRIWKRLGANGSKRIFSFCLYTIKQK